MKLATSVIWWTDYVLTRKNHTSAFCFACRDCAAFNGREQNTDLIVPFSLAVTLCAAILIIEKKR